MEADRNGLEVLGSEECRHVLRAAAVGRIGFSSAARDLSEDEVGRIDRAERVRVTWWVSGSDDRMAAISCELVSGRRIVPGLSPEGRPPASEEART